ncbi:MAG TPA: nucleotide exchange factor GrpE [Rhodospirillaceae bacterium]|nr:nucleotide exchange factor GrpE [Magnetovibrio sp.]HBT42307.1 nucleotide exchange factor GrpE [Rhodospirillaceae bacterium]HCS70686.1 nucleotide exchange factor GrpE [Rhodospirillaceae bacterium]
MSETTPEQTPDSAPEDTAAAADAAQPEAPASDAVPDGEPPIPSMTADAGEADPAQRVAALEAQLAEANDRTLRALAEAENVRRRAERDKQDASRYAIANFAREILTVGDNLRRALDSVDAEARKSSDVVETLMTGVEMTERALLSVLERSGIKRLDPLGERFDSNAHEALFEVPDPTQPQGTVAQVIEAGYTLNDRLLRPAKVGVTKGGPKPEPVAAAAEEAAPAATEGKDGSKAYEKDAGGAGGRVDEKL